MATVNDSLDTTAVFDENKVKLLEQLVSAMLTGTPQEREFAHDQLNRLKADNEAWRIVGQILVYSGDTNTRFFALSILEECINQKWNILPDIQRTNIKQYITDLAIKSSVDSSVSNSKYFITKVNSVFIQVVKKEWPQNWPTFIPDLCTAAKSNIAFFENSLKILSLLSEEVFDFGQSNLTTTKAYELRCSLNSQLQQVLDLCMFSMQNYPQNIPLMVATFQCLTNYLKWIPCDYIFETGLIDSLMMYFWDPAVYRIHVVRILIEIASLQEVPPRFHRKLGMFLWVPITNKISALSDSSLQYNINKPAQSNLFWEHFYLPMSIFLTNMLRNFRTTVCEVYPDSVKGVELTVQVLTFLNKMTDTITHEETFKICLDYWNHFAEVLYKKVFENYKKSHNLDSMSNIPIEQLVIENPENYSEELRVYQPILISTAKSLISRMARPQEVCIRYDEETGTVDRDYEVDTDEVALYNIMRETLIYITNLGNQQMQNVMIDVLNKVSEKAKNLGSIDWNPAVLCRLCWAIGSISGSFSVERESSFLIFVIQRLFWLCEHKRGVKNKAVIASVIMYIFGQYPRFLNKYVKFLATVLSKLFEFMEEDFEGVQEMACETFLKIATKCSKSIATSILEHGKPLIEQIIPQIPHLYQYLKIPSKQTILYVGLGYIIAAVEERQKQEMYIHEICAPFYTQWSQIMIDKMAPVSQGYITEFCSADVARKIVEILRVYDRLANGVGAAFTQQFMAIYMELIQCYKIFSSFITQKVTNEGFGIISHLNIKTFRQVKRASLLLIRSYITSSTSSASAELSTIKAEIVQYIIPAFLDSILEDYQSNFPQLREYEVLKLFTSLVIILNKEFAAELPKVFSAMFDCTLDMIKTDFHSYPDHRIHFYEFLEASTTHCFETLFLLPEATQNLFIESLLWAIKHEQPTVAENGLKIMHILLKNITLNFQFLVPFFYAMYWKITQTILIVMTDTFHKSGSQYQALILMQLIQIVNLDKLNTMNADAITKEKVMLFLKDLLTKFFPNLNEKKIDTFVINLFNYSGNPKNFAQHLKNFIIESKEFSGSSDLFENERQDALKEAEKLKIAAHSMIPGMIPQYTAAELAKPEDFE